MARARAFFGLLPSQYKDDELLSFFNGFVEAVKRAMPPPGGVGERSIERNENEQVTAKVGEV